MNRRQFLRHSLFLPPALLAAGMASTAAHGAQLPYQNRTLVLVELNGGNDGLNTVVPYADPLYHRWRPNLAINADAVLRLDESLGLHPALFPLLAHWQQREMAIALGVGYAQPNLSHFRSIEIWNQASDSDTFLDSGWVAKAFLEVQPPTDIAADGVVLGRNEIGPLIGPNLRTVSLKSTNGLKSGLKMRNSSDMTTTNPALRHILQTGDQLRQTAEAILTRHIDGIPVNTDFPSSPFAQQLELAARLMISGARIPAIKTSLGSFDTHINQPDQHARLLEQLAQGLAAFAATLKSHGLWDQVLILTYGEFGRRPTENSSNGTDHGTAAPHFLLGGKVRGGFYGAQPPLDALEGDNLAYRIHFKQLYASVCRDWWGLKAEFLDQPSLNCLS